METNNTGKDPAHQHPLANWIQSKKGHFLDHLCPGDLS